MNQKTRMMKRKQERRTDRALAMIKAEKDRRAKALARSGMARMDERTRKDA